MNVDDEKLRNIHAVSFDTLELQADNDSFELVKVSSISRSLVSTNQSSSQNCKINILGKDKERTSELKDKLESMEKSSSSLLKSEGTVEFQYGVSPNDLLFKKFREDLIAHSKDVYLFVFRVDDDLSEIDYSYLREIVKKGVTFLIFVIQSKDGHQNDEEGNTENHRGIEKKLKPLGLTPLTFKLFDDDNNLLTMLRRNLLTKWTLLKNVKHDLSFKDSIIKIIPQIFIIFICGKTSPEIILKNIEHELRKIEQKKERRATEERIAFKKEKLKEATEKRTRELQDMDDKEAQRIIENELQI